MIAHNSKSYPYLAIAQRYEVPYGEVLKYADDIKDYMYSLDFVMVSCHWQQAVWNLELNRNGRRHD